MLDALLLIQDVQLLCFTIIFGFVALQYPQDRVRRWFWISFVANGIGAIGDFVAPHLPLWISRGINLEMIPLSYALVNVAVVHFLRRYRHTYWISAAIIGATLPVLLLWSGHTDPAPADSVVDFAIGVQCLCTAIILLRSRERSTAFPRRVLSAFFLPFAGIELFRAWIAYSLHVAPDVWSHQLEITSSVAYIVSTSVLPLAFLWMISSRSESDLVIQNLHDPLTQVLNRRGLRQALDRELSHYAATGQTLSLAILDLDYFKVLNDRHGHAAGDAVLIALATLLRNALRDSDTVARMGGEEFVLLMPNTSSSAAAALLERLRIEIENHTEHGEQGPIRTTASFGGVSTHGQKTTATVLLRDADRALYQAKAHGRNRVHFASEEDVRSDFVKTRLRA